MPRETSDKLDDVFLSSALHQAQAATLRFAGTPPGTESAREVYLSACAEIGSALQPLGFKYTKSAQRCVRKVEPFSYTVSFQSSHNNVSGHHVRLWTHGVVRSKALESWRAERLPENLVSDYVAGGMVHRLSGVHSMVEWELADPDTRAGTIADIVTFVGADVLPYFKLFERPADVIARLAITEIPAFDLRPSVEFAMCFGSPRDGQAVLTRFLESRPDLHDGIAEAERQGLPKSPYGPGNFAEEVAFMRRIYRLQ